MEFKLPFLLAMRDQAPRMFNQLRRSGQMDKHLDQKSHEAHELLRSLLPENPSLPQEREADEVV